jgi:hypothetical protein
MNRDELREALRREGISARAYSLTGARKNEALVLARRDQGWMVYYCERGQETDVQPFDDEDSACKYVLSSLKSWHTAREVHQADENVDGDFRPWWRQWLGRVRTRR